ncbi:hypothetical protein GOP47_0014507 [Adiantum capillus-veneris]|uniref:Uncharacterized protein n=1 Tax=Adiantum capillus-veneris TaxID=13818 RepID=A0A9D4ZCI4_ADICA|nr:hypothetical protein GOP47_0014507 [Adiantum capillus-veneris]
MRMTNKMNKKLTELCNSTSQAEAWYFLCYREIEGAFGVNAHYIFSTGGQGELNHSLHGLQSALQGSKVNIIPYKHWLQEMTNALIARHKSALPAIDISTLFCYSVILTKK